MEIHWTYDGCDQEDEARIERYWEREQIELEGKIAQVLDVPSELRMAVEREEATSSWQVHAALHFPGRTLVSNRVGNAPEETLDNVLRELAAQLDRVDDSPAAVADRREGVQEMLPSLVAWRKQGRSEAFMSFLVPVVTTFGSYVQRELQVRENEGTLSGEEISTNDVLDEVLVQAWEQFNGRQNKVPLDLWLVRLADQAIDRLGAQVADESIDDEQPEPSRESRESERDEWIEQVSYPESIELSELLTDGPGIDTWDGLELETKQAHLAEMLGSLARERRQAFVLNLAHGFNVAEIADFQNRTTEQVETDIASAVAEVRRYVIDQQTPDREDPFAKADMREQQRRKF